MSTITREDALEYHKLDGRPGKVSVVPTKPIQTQRDLSLAYTPGVAVPVLEIAEKPDLGYEYTSKGNLVAVVSNGTAILGLGGEELSLVHGEDTGLAISRINPKYFGALTLMIIPGSPIEKWIRRREFTPLNSDDILEELKIMLQNINVKNEMVFRTNHASNYLPLKGILPRDKNQLLNMIIKAQKKEINLRPEHLRGL